LSGQPHVSRMLPDVLVQLGRNRLGPGRSRTVATTPATHPGHARTWLSHDWRPLKSCQDSRPRVCGCGRSSWTRSRGQPEPQPPGQARETEKGRLRVRNQPGPRAPVGGQDRATPGDNVTVSEAEGQENACRAAALHVQAAVPRTSGSGFLTRRSAARPIAPYSNWRSPRQAGCCPKSKYRVRRMMRWPRPSSAPRIMPRWRRTTE
jgi:hypothetical protein